jgi:hypothetical protein
MVSRSVLKDHIDRIRAAQARLQAHGEHETAAELQAPLRHYLRRLMSLRAPQSPHDWPSWTDQRWTTTDIDPVPTAEERAWHDEQTRLEAPAPITIPIAPVCGGGPAPASSDEWWERLYGDRSADQVEAENAAHWEQFGKDMAEQDQLARDALAWTLRYHQGIEA